MTSEISSGDGQGSQIKAIGPRGARTWELAVAVKFRSREPPSSSRALQFIFLMQQ
jgi:hypothetical protein